MRRACHKGYIVPIAGCMRALPMPPRPGMHRAALPVRAFRCIRAPHARARLATRAQRNVNVTFDTLVLGRSGLMSPGAPFRGLYQPPNADPGRSPQ